MAAVDSFKIVVHGKQTHGAYPWLGVDPIVIASQIVLGLQTIPSRQLDSTIAPSIVTVVTHWCTDGARKALPQVCAVLTQTSPRDGRPEIRY